jgi:hypothetical protein
MNPRAAALAAILATVCALAAGCRAVTATALVAGDEPVAADADAGRRSSLVPRTLPVEVHFVRHDPRDPAFGVDLWNHVDEQALDADLRRRLAANGLRAGVITGHLPADVADRLAPNTAVDPATPDAAGLRRLLRLLPGKRAEVVATTGQHELALLEHGAEGVTGATYRDVTSQFALQAWPDADGRIRIRVVPELKHGPVRRSWVGEEGMFRLETGQARRAFDDLSIATPLPAGATLLVGVTDEEGAAVGDALLRERSAGGGVRLLVIRPPAAATDPVFATAAGGPETPRDGS